MVRETTQNLLKKKQVPSRMSFYTLLYVIALIIIFLIIFKITKKIIKAITISIIIIVVLVIIISSVLITDYNILKDNIHTKPSLVMIKEKDALLSAALFQFEGNNQLQELASHEFLIIKQDFENNDYDTLTSNYFKLLIMDINTLINSEKPVTSFEGREFAKEQVISAIRSEDPAGLLSLDYQEKNTLKILLFTSFFSKTSEFDIDIVLDNYKSGNISIYKETIIFKLIRILPSFLLEILIKKTI